MVWHSASQDLMCLDVRQGFHAHSRIIVVWLTHLNNVIAMHRSSWAIAVEYWDIQWRWSSFGIRSVKSHRKAGVGWIICLSQTDPKGLQLSAGVDIEISVIEPHAMITNTCVLSIWSYPRTFAFFQGCSVNVTYLAGALNSIECEQHPLIWC